MAAAVAQPLGGGPACPVQPYAGSRIPFSDPSLSVARPVSHIPFIRIPFIY